jgi:hypothetical protein
MTVKQDAAEILAYAYKQQIEKTEDVTEKGIIQVTGWVDERVRRAIQFLVDKGLLGAKKMLEGNFLITRGITTEGINVIENSEETQHTFGMGINIGIFQFSWSRTK